MRSRTISLLATTLAVLLGIYVPAPGAGNSNCDLSVVFRSGAGAYDEALSGIRESLGGSPCRVQYLDLAAADAQRALPAALQVPPKLVIAVGIGAWQQVAAAKPASSLLASLVLPSDLKPDDPHRAGAVFADVPLRSTIEILRELFPKASRVTLIHHSGWPAPDAGLAAYARQMGLDLRVAECTGPEKLLSVFSSLKGRTDLVIAEPDAELYNSATIKPLVLASIEHRLPLVGFSAGFVRAGALVGVYPDFHELGRQTGELASELLAGKPERAGESVRKMTVAVNPRLERLLGIEAARRAGMVVLE